MSRRVTLTVICDRCGLTATYEMLSAGYELIATLDPYPEDWQPQPLIGGGKFRGLDYCPDCSNRKE